jgi:hypothetical protein
MEDTTNDRDEFSCLHNDASLLRVRNPSAESYHEK